jgi:hypothetical protein
VSINHEIDLVAVSKIDLTKGKGVYAIELKSGDASSTETTSIQLSTRDKARAEKLVKALRQKVGSCQSKH